MMTREESDAKLQILDILNEEGYPSYAKILNKFDINLTKDMSVVAYMEPGKFRIVLNRYLSLRQVSTIVRHEILHQYFKHAAREDQELSRKNITKTSGSHKLANYAGDFEISNLGYTDADKKTVRHIILGDKVLQGLVTEDSHVDWEHKSFEEMLDLLLDQQQDDTEDGEKSIEIGSHGDDAIQAAESIERAANAVIDDAEDDITQSSKNQGSTGNATASETQDAEDTQKTAEKISDTAQDLANELKAKLGKKTDEPLRNEDGTLGDVAKIKQRIQDLADTLQNLDTQKDLLNDTKENKRKEKAAAAARDLQRYNTSPLNQFLVSLNGFIQNQIGISRDASWSKVNKNYAYSGIMMPGISNNVENKIISINVYFDRSGSWDNKQKSEIGRQGVASLNKYVREGRIKVNLYYFSDSVCSKETQALAQGGTAGQPILDHIKETHPDNVIVITDGDIKDCQESVKVPGAVWMLFVEQESENLKSHLAGKRLTKSIFIES